MADGTCDEGDSRVRVKCDAISDEVPRPWGFLSRLHMGDM